MLDGGAIKMMLELMMIRLVVTVGKEVTFHSVQLQQYAV